MAEVPATILEKLISERGGRGHFDTAQLAAARALAVALSEDVPSPKVIAGLADLLPPKAEAGVGADFNLRRLDDQELAHLEYLVARANGEKPARPKKRVYTHREMLALELAERLDDADARSGPHSRVEFSERERLEISNLLTAIGGYRFNLRKIWEGTPCGACPLRGQPPAVLDKPADGVPATTEDTSPPQPSKIVPIRQDLPKGRSIHAGAPLKGPSEPWRGHLPA